MAAGTQGSLNLTNEQPDRHIYHMDENKHEIALSTKNLEVYYGDHLALQGADLSFERFKITSLIGASGSGKSTFLRSLNRMNDDVATVKGNIMYRGLDINSHDIDVYEMRKHIGMVFQRPNPFAKSISDNITFALKQHGVHDKAKLAEIVETSLKQAALWDEVKDDLKKSASVAQKPQPVRFTAI